MDFRDYHFSKDNILIAMIANDLVEFAINRER